MKIRLDFVTNSSSSSYICEICKDSESGWDLSISDTEFMQCDRGHTFCICHLTDDELVYGTTLYMENNTHDAEEKQEWKDFLASSNCECGQDMLDWVCHNGYDGNEILYEFPSGACPICSFRYITDELIIAFILKTTGTTREEIDNAVRKSLKGN